MFVAALQPALTMTDYLDPETLAEHLDQAVGHVLRERDGRPSLVLLPEDLGTFLPLSRLPAIDRIRTLEEALAGAARAHPGSILRTLLCHPQGFRSATLAALGDFAYAKFHPMMQALARTHRTYLAAGSLLVRQKTPPTGDVFQPEGHDVYNTAPVYDPSGRVVSVTRKSNLVPGLEAGLGLRAALPHVSPFRVGPLTMAVLICFDACTRSHVPDLKPAFQPVWPLCDQAGVDVLLQPSANPAPWHSMWPYASGGPARTEETAWGEAAVEAALAVSHRARYALTSFLTLELFGLTFEGESRIFVREKSGAIRRISEAGGYRATDGDRAATAVLA